VPNVHGINGLYANSTSFSQRTPKTQKPPAPGAGGFCSSFARTSPAKPQSD
jgi:hypothetical protein